MSRVRKLAGAAVLVARTVDGTAFLVSGEGVGAGGWRAVARVRMLSCILMVGSLAGEFDGQFRGWSEMFRGETSTHIKRRLVSLLRLK